MKRTKLIVGAFAALTLAGAAQAQAPAALEGMVVRGQNGVVLGVVERVTYRDNGAPAQVLVRPKGPPTAGPRSLSYGALRKEGGELTAPLTQAEFNAMPAVNVAPK
ncbi:MAG: hypothetical protein ACREEO_14550 [Phenylobacterium sp.]